MSDFSVIQAVDFGLGQHLARIYSTGHDDGPRNWRQLLQRPPQTKIFRGDYDDPEAIIGSIESGKKQRQSSEWLQANAPSLPLIAYGRKPNIEVIEPEAAGHQFARYATTDSGQQVKLSLAMVLVEYRLTLMAWDKPTLDAMQLAWLFHVGNAAERGHKFDLAYDIDSEPLDGITAEIIDPKTVTFEDASLAANEGRLHAVSLPVRVRAYAIQGARVSVPERMRWQLEVSVGGETINVSGDSPSGPSGQPYEGNATNPAGTLPGSVAVPGQEPYGGHQTGSGAGTRDGDDGYVPCQECGL